MNDMKRMKNSTMIAAIIILTGCCRQTAFSAIKQEVLTNHTPNRVDTLLKNLRDVSSDYVFVLAHRGDWRNEPENSLRGAERTIRMGADMLEVDVRMTKDSVLVLMHDLTIDRTTTGKGNVEDFTLAELKQFYLKECNGEVVAQRIPTFKELMMLCKGRILIVADKGENLIRQIEDVLKETGTEGQVIYKGGRPVRDLKQYNGQLLDHIIYVPLIGDNWTDFASYIEDFIQLYKPVAFEVTYRTEDSPMFEQIEKMQKNGCRVWASSMWAEVCAGHTDERGFDEPDESWGWIINHGASIIQTNRAKDLIDYLESINRRKLLEN
jgi:glycerophosphoryl diester phosphodiesterase